MSAIQFTATVGPDGAIHPPAGLALPQGLIEVSVRSSTETKPSLEDLGRELATRRGLNWDSLPKESHEVLIEDVKYEALGLRRPRPGPGACKGMILYMAPDFDAPLEDMKEYME